MSDRAIDEAYGLFVVHQGARYLYIWVCSECHPAQASGIVKHPAHPKSCTDKERKAGRLHLGSKHPAEHKGGRVHEPLSTPSKS